ncbi:FAD-binding oxidoreductase [Kitasatospora atroaurantiaca]|uniref:FAD/FMN-containing dehydrogenase n=1 Tax=Kitasatospora atroaurantiaca TaxID=285545 RepID=A0A561EZA0_9ACTN|nr:FAD-binding oxidoreductase [Kitasatospora atroaurantiaca]TWE20930.1 FAD/FMN-containing dehydrogenase [Kitasatospora atroaurantiaca]
MNAKTAVALRRGFRGQVIVPGDPEYDRARAVWNGAIDRRPDVIARCTGTADVLRAVEMARRYGLLTAVRGGGHNIAGLGVCDGGLVIDLSPMKGVRVDAARWTARAQPGVTWGDFDHETQAFSLATPGCLMSSTGIAGFTLGGGFGWLSRAYGLACDNLLEADVVTADGKLVTASSEQHPDLFWGIRGGGGNFGIVTSFTYRLHPVGRQVLCGAVFLPAERLPEVLSAVRDHLAGAPDELFVSCVLSTAPAAPFLPAEVHGTPVVRVGMCWAGPPDRGVSVLAPLRGWKGALADTVQTRPYVVWQRMLDSGWGPGALNHWKAEYLTVLNGAAIETIADHVARISSPLSGIELAFLGGAIARVGADDTAYTHRAAPCLLNINSRWETGAPDEHIAWTGRFWSAMRPYSSGGVYVNFLGQEGRGRVLEAYGLAKFERLTALKDRYDPGNLFRVNQNIPPSV